MALQAVGKHTPEMGATRGTGRTYAEVTEDAQKRERDEEGGEGKVVTGLGL